MNLSIAVGPKGRFLLMGSGNHWELIDQLMDHRTVLSAGSLTSMLELIYDDIQLTRQAFLLSRGLLDGHARQVTRFLGCIGQWKPLDVYNVHLNNILLDSRLTPMFRRYFVGSAAA